ncbi:MAG: dihydrofolate reductase [Chitinophagales bacterium]
MIISILVAVSQNNVIGRENKIPWHLPADMKYFKQLTMNHHIIMGRATYESIGRPLPGRVNVVVTRQENYSAPDCVVVSDIRSAFDYCIQHGETECFVIGGGDIIRQSLVWADKVYMTAIFHDFEGDTFFPELNPDDWKLVSEERHLPDEKNHYAFAFRIYGLSKLEQAE